jgi:diaminopimelate epimerase
MGRVSFQSDLIPVSGARREVIGEELQAGGKRFVVNAATIGNPHCVIVVPELDKEEVLRYGPLLEHHPQFPRRTNVQFLKVIDRSTIQIEIWERGAGYTLASGSSSSASAAVARRLGLVGEDVTVRMPGGELSIHIASDYAIRMTGPVTGVSTGTLVEECLIGAE